MTGAAGSEYQYTDAAVPHTAAYLYPTVFAELDRACPPGGDRRVLDLGCGNGSLAAALAARGFDVTGVDASESGIAVAKTAHPGDRIAFHVGSCYDDLAGRFGRYPAVVSLEVVEHVYYPRKFAACVADLLRPGGTLILSTPYHGYWKNLAMAVTGKMDAHFTALWDHGHIKFWSVKTLTTLLTEAGLDVVRFHRVGRLPALAKAMIAVARRPR